VGLVKFSRVYREKKIVSLGSVRLPAVEFTGLRDFFVATVVVDVVDDTTLMLILMGSFNANNPQNHLRGF